MPDLAGTLVWPLFLIFARLGTALMVFPGLSDDAILARARLLVALGASVVLLPLLGPQLPPLPPTGSAALMVLFGELMIGLMMGLGARMLMAALSLAGELLAFAGGLQAATMFDPQSQSSSGAPTIFLTLTGGVLILSLGLHHDLIRAIAASYTAMPAGELPAVDDALQAVVRLFTTFTILGIQLAAPVVVAGLLVTALFGILNRLIPQLQVYFVSIPLNVFIMFALLAASLPLLLEVWATVVSENFSLFLVEN